ncbi:MAG: hypothetical protein ACJAYU_005301, partial [Bradymonadia bacterium]
MFLKRRRVLFFIGFGACAVWAGWFAPKQSLHLASTRLAAVAQSDPICEGPTASLEAA